VREREWVEFLEIIYKLILRIMFFISRYNTQYIEFRETLKEIRSWSFEPSKKAVFNKVDKFNILDETARNILLEKMSFILTNKDVYLDLNTVEEIDLFVSRRLGIRDGVLNSNLLNRDKIENNFTDVIPAQNNDSYVIFNDPLLLTTIEVVLVFTKETKNKEVLKSFKKIFTEKTSLKLNKHLIFFDILPDIRFKLNLLKDDKLNHLLKSYYIAETKNKYQDMARVISDIVKRIFLPNKGKKCKKDRIINSILNRSYKIESNRTEEKKIIKMDLDSKYDFITNIIDKIYGIRHTENWTIDVKDQYVYKLIAHTGIDLITLYINANEKTFLDKLDTPKKIREEYYKEFGRQQEKREINVEEIPF